MIERSFEFIDIARGRHERYACTHEYRGTGRYPAKRKNLGYRWVPGTDKILEVWYPYKM